MKTSPYGQFRKGALLVLLGILTKWSGIDIPALLERSGMNKYIVKEGEGQ